MVIRTTEANENSTKLDDRWSDQKRVPVVYFDLVEIAGMPPRIKIGESGNHKKRLKNHAKSHLGIEINARHLCVVRGSRSDEQFILRYFRQHKLENEEETFWPHDDLVDYIRWLRDQYFVWVEDCEQCPEDVNEIDVVDSSLWLPNNERRKPKPPQRGLFSEFGELDLPPREVTADDFYTNPLIIEAARKTLGSIDLDPASHAIANRNVKAKRIFTIRDDGLSRSWEGNVWCNPPFSQWQLWVPKIIKESQSRLVKAMCVLCATRTITAQYFSAIHEKCNAACVLRGRIRFLGSRAGDSPDDGHMVFYFGEQRERFRESFSELGNVYYRC